MPSFNLEPTDDFDTIDDSILANLVYDSDLTNENKQNSNNQVAVPQPQNPQNPPTFNTQVNTFNQNLAFEQFQRLPQMYFPHSSVTINYNFNNK